MVDPRGEPVIGVPVEVTTARSEDEPDPEGGFLPRPPWKYRQVVTGPNGCFVVEGLWPGSVMILAGRGTDWVHETPFLPIWPRIAAPGEDFDLGDLELQPAVTVTGRVVGPGGDPVSDAVVAFVPFLGFPIDDELPDPGPLLTDLASFIADGSKGHLCVQPAFGATYLRQQPRWTTTAADGRFRLAGAQPRSGLIVVRPGDGMLKRAWMTRLKAHGGQTFEIGRLTIGDGYTLRCRVLNHAGRPVRGAEVMVTSPRSMHPIGPTFCRAGTTGADGRLTARGLISRRVTIAARARNGTAWAVLPYVLADKEHDIHLGNTFAISVEVVDAAGRPVSEAELKLMSATEKTARALGQDPGDTTCTVPLTLRCGSSAPGRYRIWDLSPGRYWLAASSLEHGSVCVTVDPTIREYRLELRKGIRHRCRVVDLKGRPVSNAKIEVHAGPAVNRVRTNPDGWAALPPAGEPGWVGVDHPAFSYDSESDLPASFEFRVGRESKIVGRIRVPGPKCDFSDWQAIVERVGDPTGVGGGSTWEMMTFHIRADGAVLGLLPEGTYEVEYLSDGFGREVDFHIGDGGTRFTALPGRPSPFVIHATPQPPLTAVLRGHLRMNGEAPAGAMLECGNLMDFRNPMISVPVDETGSFRTKLPARAGHTLMFRTKSTTRLHDLVWAGSVDLEDKTRVDLDIVIETGTLAGKVLGPDGRPAPRVLVLANGTLPRVSGIDYPPTSGFVTRTDSKGSFRFENAPAGQYDLEANLFDRLGVARGVELRAGETKKLTLQLRWLHAVRGRLTWQRILRGVKKAWVEMGGAGTKARRIFGFLVVGDPPRLVEDPSAVVGGDGRFIVTDMEPGTYPVTFALVGGSKSNLLQTGFWNEELRLKGPKLIVEDKDLEVQVDLGRDQREEIERMAKEKGETVSQFLARHGLKPGPEWEK